MITYVAFQAPVTCEAYPGGTADWSLARDDGRVKVADKGNHILLSWTASSGKWKGREMRVKVPLTNITQLTEVDDAEPAPPKEKK